MARSDSLRAEAGAMAAVEAALSRTESLSPAAQRRVARYAVELGQERIDAIDKAANDAGLADVAERGRIAASRRPAGAQSIRLTEPAEEADRAGHG